jgi:hypothetical protein
LGMSLLGLALLGHGSGCRSATPGGDAQAARSEAARLSQLIDRLRAADNAQKKEWLTLLEAEPCSELCRLKQTCHGAYQEHVAALEAIQEVKAFGTAIPTPAGMDEGALVAAKLDEAERRLDKARKLSAECVEAQGSVKFRHKL